MIKFEWDEHKNTLNRAKHGVWFEEAQSSFDDLHGRLFLDPDSEEERFVLVAVSSGTHLLIVVHCYRGSKSMIRIISARKATKRERVFYEKGI